MGNCHPEKKPMSTEAKLRLTSVLEGCQFSMLPFCACAVNIYYVILNVN